MRLPTTTSNAWIRSRSPSAVMLVALVALIAPMGCANSRPQDRPLSGGPTASPAVVSETPSTGASHGERATIDPVTALIESTPAETVPATTTRGRLAPPPRVNGKTFNTAIVDEHGQTRRIEIRLRDSVAETRIDGQLVPADRVLVHRRGFVEVIDAEGARELSFNLPRGMTSIARASR